MNQGQVVVEKLKIKEAESQYEIIKARCKIDENKLKEINFQQSIEIKKNNHRVLFPVVHKNCQYINTPDHICGCLAQIIQNSHDLTKCGQLSLANQNDLQVPVIPYFAAQSVHQNTDIVSIIQGFIMNKILRPAQYIKPLSDPKPQQLFREMMNRKDDCNNFSNRIKMDDRYKQLEGFEFYAACLFDWVKLNIPMRFKTCNHIECFDMTSIVFRLENEILKQKNVQEQNRKYDKITCGFNVDGSYCPSFCVGTYENMIAELVIDYELMDAIRKSEQEAYKFVYIKQNTLILDELTYANKQQLLKQGNAKIKIKQIDSINIQPTSLKIGDYSIIQVMNLRNRQAAVQKQTQFQKYQDIEIELICPISQKAIQYPARCSLCPQQQCADIKSMIEDFNIKKINQKDSFFRCPLCKMEQKKRYCGLVPQNVYYFDEFIMGIIMQKRNPNSSKLIYKGSQVLLNEYQQQHRILKEQIQDLYPKKRVQYSKLVCCVSNKLLKDPLIIRDCQEYTRVSFESFFNLYKLHGYLEDANIKIIICKCMGCNQSGITRIDQLAYDQMLAEALEVYNKLGPQQKKKINIEEEITYDYSTKELIDDPNKIKKVKYPTNPVHRGFLSEMTSEEFEEYAKQFEPQLIDGKVIQLNQIQVNQFGIKQVQNSQGVFVQNKQEMLDQYNTVGKSDQFNKWGLQINDVKVNYKKKNVDDSEQDI